MSNSFANPPVGLLDAMANHHRKDFGLLDETSKGSGRAEPPLISGALSSQIEKILASPSFAPLPRQSPRPTLRQIPRLATRQIPLAAQAATSGFVDLSKFIGIQEAWECAGGNPSITATRDDLIQALRTLDAVCAAADTKEGIPETTLVPESSTLPGPLAPTIAQGQTRPVVLRRIGASLKPSGPAASVAVAVAVAVAPVPGVSAETAAVVECVGSAITYLTGWDSGYYPAGHKAVLAKLRGCDAEHGPGEAVAAAIKYLTDWESGQYPAGQLATLAKLRGIRTRSASPMPGRDR